MTLAERLASLGRHTGLREIFLFRIANGQKGRSFSLMLRYPADTQQPPPSGKSLKRALHLVCDTSNPFITVRRTHVREQNGAVSSGGAEALMVAPVFTFENTVWGAMVGIGPDSAATAAMFRSLIQTAEQIGGQLSSWGRSHVTPAPLPHTTSSQINIASPEILLHELRTPLAAATLLIDAVERAHASNDDEVVQRALRTLRLSLADAVQVAQWWNELRQHNLHPQIEAVSVEAALRHALTISAQSSSRTRFTISSNTPLVLTDKLMLNRVFINLIDNAFRHGTPEGTLEVSTQVIGDTVQVRFLNDGVMPAEMIESLARPEHSPDASKKAAHGFGLSIVKALLHEMGGSLTVESDTLQWTAFTVTLPAAREASAPQSEES